MENTKDFKKIIELLEEILTRLSKKESPGILDSLTGDDIGDNVTTT